MSPIDGLWLDLSCPIVGSIVTGQLSWLFFWGYPAEGDISEGAAAADVPGWPCH